MLRRHLGTAAIASLIVAAMAAFAGSSSAVTPRHYYVLRHPKREHCKRHYVRKVVTVKRRVHGHPKKVRLTLCVRVRPKAAPSTPRPQPATPEQAAALYVEPTPVPPTPRPARETREPKAVRRPAPPACTSTFTGAGDNLWGTAANWTGGVPSGFSAYGCVPSEYPGTVIFTTPTEAPVEVGGIFAENADGITLKGGHLTLADPELESLINNIKPGNAAVTLAEGVTLEATGTTGELGANTWNGPGTLEIPRGAFLRTGTCASWSGARENRCVDGTPTPAYEGLQVRNLGTIWGAGILLCRNWAAHPAKLENDGVLRIILSGSFYDESGCAEPGAVINGERGIIGIAQLDGYGCDVRVGMASLLNEGLIKLGACLKPETEEVQRATLQIGGTLTEAGTIIDAGIVQVGGDYTPTSRSNLTVSIRQTFPAGSPETNYGAVKVSGSATLAGELNIETDRLKGRPLVLGETFQILDVGGSLAGEFTLGAHCIPAEPGDGYKVIYRSGNKGTVTVEVAEVAGC